MSFEDWQEISQEKQERIHKIIEQFNAKEIKMFDLKDYKPEKVTMNEFEPIKGKNFICKVNSSLIEKVEAGSSEDGSRTWDDYTRLRYELEIIDDNGKGFKGRRVWKSYNLDSDKRSGKKEQTPVEKLADVFFTLGLEFKDLSSLESANEKFVEMELLVSFSTFKGNDGEEVQMHYINGINESEWEKEDKPSF